MSNIFEEMGHIGCCYGLPIPSMVESVEDTLLAMIDHLLLFTIP